MKFLDTIPLPLLLFVALFLGMAPLEPEPHLVEKLRMLVNGELNRPIDIFDLCFHASGIVLLLLKLVRMMRHSPPSEED